ncbi:MAG: TIGR02757 family protein [Bacteroidota bacterium]|nr:TIGR02757 family protein [Bacteroidota bacterium]
MNFNEFKDFLDEKVLQYNQKYFIDSDPIQIPHLFTQKQDIEIAGFLTATIAWGNRKMIIKNAYRIMELLGNNPYDFVMNHSDNELSSLNDFVHRTFNGVDLEGFVKALRGLYTKYDSLELIFNKYDNLQEAIHCFRNEFFSFEHQIRTQKHLSDPRKGSAAKRLNMFLRWMVRNDGIVDFGIWQTIPPSKLSCPLDVHSGNVARRLGLLHRKQNDAKALMELDNSLRALDVDDPVKYDYALFGLGVFEGFR